MGASQTLQLTEADIPKETATELLEFVEKKQTNLVTEDYLEARMAATDAKIITVKSELDAKIDKLDMKIVSIKSELDAKIGKLDAKIEKLDAKIDKLDMKVVAVKNELNAKIDKQNTKINGLMLFLGFNTTLLVALIILVLRMSFG